MTADDGFGVVVREQREWRGWSQAELARRIGRDHSTVSRLEAAQRVPSWSLLLALVRELPGLVAAIRVEAERAPKGERGER